MAIDGRLKYFWMYDIKERAAQEGEEERERKLDIGGYFTCPMYVASFLGIENLSNIPPNPVMKKRTGGRRSKTRIVGSVGGEGTGQTSAVSDSYIAIPLPKGRPGSKTVQIKTFKPVLNSGVKNKAKIIYHQISFRFPGWASNLDISDALGSIIPPEKFALSADEDRASKIERFFRPVGGRRYQIMSPEQAANTPAGEKGVEVPNNETEAAALAAKVAGEGA